MSLEAPVERRGSGRFEPKDGMFRRGVSCSRRAMPVSPRTFLLANGSATD